MSFPRKRESILGNDIMDARFHGHDNALLLLLEATVFQQALKAKGHPAANRSGIAGSHRRCAAEGPRETTYTHL